MAYSITISLTEYSTINLSDRTDKARHDRMVALVTQMLEIRF